ncbi:hypothetical protein CEXT_650351 [Caerostris extrusa]|uniref:Uncharacterized protein n=1 Tax=Caerostris extrusa TaxID=172846 RepID=A0AAV4N0N3_CAEEX|nr:hypothetical protein CEXT_650351 [Caerostris extrusa]
MDLNLVVTAILERIGQGFYPVVTLSTPTIKANSIARLLICTSTFRTPEAPSDSEGTAVPSSSQGAEGGTLSASGARPKTKRMLSLIKRLPKKVKAQINPQSAIE